MSVRAPLRLVTAPVLAAAALGAAAVAAVLFRYDPAEFGFYPRCVLFVATGIYCPGCGALRAAHQLLHGNLLGALDYNVFFVLALPFLVYWGVAQGVGAATGRTLPSFRLSGRATWLLFAGILAFTLLRNFPYAPFAVLAPLAGRERKIYASGGRRLMISRIAAPSSAA